MRISDGSSDVCSSDLTSVPGVAQRTGATIYYLERIPEDLVARAGRPPVLAMMPTPGDVNLVLAAELMEGGRAIGRGLVTPDRTTLITSSHRSYAISEKSAPRSEEHTSELQSLMRISYAVFCLKKKNKKTQKTRTT